MCPFSASAFIEARPGSVSAARRTATSPNAPSANETNEPRSGGAQGAVGCPEPAVGLECPRPRLAFGRLQVRVALPRGPIDARLKALAWRRTGCGAARPIRQRIGLYGG